MILKLSIAAGLLLGGLVLALRWHSPADPVRTGAVIAARVLKTVERGDYDAFIAEADRSVRKMHVDEFRALTSRHAPRLRSGYELRALDDRSRGAVHVSRWKISFRDGSREAVLTLGVKDGKVATFAIY